MKRQASPSPRLMLGALGAAVLVAGGAYAHFFGSATFALGPSAEDNAKMPTQVTFTKGEEQTFSVHMKSAVRLQGKLHPAQGSVMTVDLSGTLHLLTLGANAHAQSEVLLRITEPNLSFTQGAKIASAADMPLTRRGITEGLVIDYQKDGVIASFRPQADLDRFADQLLRQAASGLQFSLAGSGLSGAWTQDEIDGTGSYAASYHLVADARDASGATQVLVLDKEKTGYASIAATTTGAGMGITGEVRGHFTARIDQLSGWPRDVNGDETASVALGQGQGMTSSVTTTYSYRYLGRQELSAEAAEKLRKATVHLAAGVTPAQHHAALLKSYAAQRLGATTLSELKSQEDKLAELEPGQRSNAGRAVFDKTVDYVRVHEGDLHDLQASLANKSATDPWLLNTLTALAHVGCASCQSALLQEVMAHSSDANFATSLVTMLSQPQIPSLAIEQALRGLALSPDPDTKMTAQLSLGIVANKLEVADNHRATAIVADYLAQFNQAASPTEKLATLAVLGNSGSPLIMPAVGTLLVDSSDQVRTAAVQALRNVTTMEAAATLGKMLADPSPQVRLAAVQSFGQQPSRQTTGEVLAGRLATETSPTIRSAIVQQLGPYYQNVPTARSAVDSMANNDPDMNVRVLAKNTATMHGAH